MGPSFSDLATLLARGISHCRMYFVDHPRVDEAAADFCELLSSLLPEHKLDAFRLGVSGDKLIHEGQFLVGPSIVGSSLTEFADLLCASGFEITPGIETPELKAFFDLAAEASEKQPDLATAQRLLTSRGVGHVTLMAPHHDHSLLDAEEDDAGLARAGLSQLIPVYRSLFDTVEKAHRNASRDCELDLTAARTTGEALVQASRDSLTDIMTLVDYPDFDSYTVGHSVRVAMLAVLVGRQAGLDEATLGELAAASLLHDVGKGKIPPEVLFKPGKLDSEERRIIETHPAIGAAMLLESRDAGALAVATAWGHHRRYDGGGYPRMPYATHISELTQLVHVCDVFEALTAVRPYKRAMTPRDAYAIILRNRDAYSPLAVTALRKAVGLYPPGSRVVLSTGQQALVTAAGPRLESPRVRLTHDAAGAEIPAELQSELDLSASDQTATVTRLLIGA